MSVMAKRCEISGVGVQSGNLVSHSNRKTRRRFLPNLQSVTLKSELLNRDFKLSITVSTLRSVDHNGGLDNYLLSTADKNLTAQAIKIKRVLRKASEAKNAA